MSAADHFRVKNPDFAEDVRSHLARMPLASFLGLEATDLAPGRAEVCLPFREELCQTAGFVQGGVVGLLADVAGAAAAGTLLPEGWTLMTIDYSVNLVAPAVGERLVARAAVTRDGGTVTVSRVEVLAQSRGRERLCAVALVTVLNREPVRGHVSTSR